MPPSSEYTPKSSLGIKQPKRIHSPLYNGFWWLQDKSDDDGAEGLWRIHDDLYDLSDFVDSHPGGSEWLAFTKGTDITEAFEVHHLTSAPENLLPKFHVRKTKVKRNAPFTFHEDGFYRTLKRKIQKALPTVPRQPIHTSGFLTDASCLLTFLFAILATAYWNFWLGVVSGCLLACTTIAAHNFLHQKDNFRMYYFNVGGAHYKEFRISHALSHHLHTNTIDDMEVQGLEPLIQYLPRKKPNWARYGCFLYSPFVWMTFFHAHIIRRLIRYFVLKQTQTMSFSDLLPFALPFLMQWFGNQPLMATFGMWNFVIAIGSLHFLAVGQNGSHHHPDIFHDGDAPRPRHEMDWGISQLDTIIDNRDLKGSHWLVLTNFGDHSLHHMFPTLDHGVLNHLYPVFEETVKEFGLNVRYATLFQCTKGNFMQKMKVQPNPKPTDLFKIVD